MSKATTVRASRGFAPRIRSRHPSHSVLRDGLERMPFRSVIRFGSTTELIDAGVEINTTEAIKNSASKLRMKRCFTEAGVKTADWIECTCKTLDQLRAWSNDRYPIVAKSLFGSRGMGNTLINNYEEFIQWMNGKTLSNYILEKYYSYSREYRLHVTSDGCFYTCRKMIKEDTPKDKRWFRNDSNSVWIVEENEQFDKPANWDKIVQECVKAMTSCGLDFGACDVRVQSATDPKSGEKRKNPEFIIVEINSAPSFGTKTAQKYLEVLPALLKKKHKLQVK